ncbi:MAG TPA: NAD(P)/FAD-dependent oxidoreductase [Longimicrobiaceae bacterium]
MTTDYDAVVIGGGPAGLACALWLARYRLRVRLYDSGDPRNAPTWAVHGYLGLQDIAPMELRRIGRAQAADAGAEIEAATVARVTGECDAFQVHLTDGRRVSTRRVVFATGLRDIIPEIAGLHDFYGTSIWHCPDCDGPSIQDRIVGVIGWGRSIAAFCMEMLTWTDRLTILTHGHDADLPPRAREALERFGIDVRTDPIERLDGRDGTVERVIFQNGDPLEVEAMFFHIAYGPGCSIPAELGCAADEEGLLKVNVDHETSVPGIYAAGDITHGSKLAIRAAAEGTRAAIGVRRSLIPPERRV